jgi:hypothetical protein
MADAGDVWSIEVIVGIAGGPMTTLRKTLLILFAVAGTLLAVLVVLLVYFRATFKP